MSSIEIPFSFLNEFNFDVNVIGITDIINLAEQNCDAVISDAFLLKEGGVREEGEIDENQFGDRMKKAFLQISKMKQCWRIRAHNWFKKAISISRKLALITQDSDSKIELKNLKSGN